MEGVVSGWVTRGVRLMSFGPREFRAGKGWGEVVEIPVRWT